MTLLKEHTVGLTSKVYRTKKEKYVDKLFTTMLSILGSYITL